MTFFRPFQTIAKSFSRLTCTDSTSYSMNSIAINPEGNLFSHVKTDPALFHAILHLVALHYDLKHGLVNTQLRLYHGGQAFRIINERLGDENKISNDMTIAAVALLAGREVSKYKVSLYVNCRVNGYPGDRT